MKIRLVLATAGLLALTALGGCSSLGKHEGTLLQTARLGCNFAGFGRGACQMGMDYFIEQNENEMYDTLGNITVRAELDTLTNWETDADKGELVVRDVRPTEFDGVTIYVLAYTTRNERGGIKSYQEVRMLAIDDGTSVRYLWQQNNAPLRDS